MVCQRKKLKSQTRTVTKTKTSWINFQEVPQQHSLVLDQRKALQVTINQKNITHERILEKTKGKLHGSESECKLKRTLVAQKETWRESCWTW